jgi:hypothetical protein
VKSTAINIVNYKTKIGVEEPWGETFYKDEGGRDKCLAVHVGIFDRHNKVKSGQSIPLQMKLCYHVKDCQPTPVGNQNILRILGTSKSVIDKAKGKARIRYRIEDVSKNHQGQTFSLEVAPDPKSTKELGPVAPGYTPPISVRSKRNKRARSTSASRSSADKKPSPVLVPMRQQKPPAEDRSPLINSAPLDPGVSNDEIVRLRQAMKGVINWAEEVVNGLFPLQWEIVGYAQNQDGSSDPSRPFYNMVNPNTCISRILNMYTENVRDDLRTLLRNVETLTQNQGGGQGSSPGRLPFSPPGNPASMDISRQHQNINSQPARASLPSGMMPPPMNMPQNSHPAEMIFPPGMPMPHQHYPMQPFMQRTHADEGMVNHNDGMQMMMGMDNSTPHMPRQPSSAMQGYDDEDSRESEVEYVLAKQFKALRTGERLGFPAYSANKEILGFYRESNTNVGVGQFTPISHHQNEFGPLEIMQATEILEEAIAKKSGMVHSLKDWGSISALMDHALVYDWSKDIGSSSEDSRRDS